MTEHETHERIIAFMIYKAINELSLRELWNGEGYEVDRQSALGLSILKSFVKKYLGLEPEEIIQTNRLRIAERRGEHSEPIPHSDETLLRIGIGEYFSEVSSLLRELET